MNIVSCHIYDKEIIVDSDVLMKYIYSLETENVAVDSFKINYTGLVPCNEGICHKIPWHGSFMPFDGDGRHKQLTIVVTVVG